MTKNVDWEIVDDLVNDGWTEEDARRFATGKRDETPAIDAVWEAAADALHLSEDHVGDWRDGVCYCKDNAGVVLRTAKVQGLLKLGPIVRALADSAEPIAVEAAFPACTLCDSRPLRDGTDAHRHEPSCSWRLAREWAAAQKDKL